MSSTNETYTDAHFNGRAYTKDQSEVIGDIYVNENILRLTGVTLDSFLFMNPNQQAMIVDIAKKAAKVSLDALLNNTRDSILMQSALGTRFFTEGKDPHKEEVSKKETPFVSAGRMFHQFMNPKLNTGVNVESVVPVNDIINIGEEEYSTKEFAELVQRFHELCIYNATGIAFLQFAKMNKLTQKLIMDSIHVSIFKPNVV